MFHVLLLPMAAAGLFVDLFVLSIPFCVGMAPQLLLTIFGREKWMLFVPAGLGVLGAAASVIWLCPSGGVRTVLIYWCVYQLALWLTWLVVSQIKRAVVERRNGGQ